MKIAADRLKQLVQDIFTQVGCRTTEAVRIAHYLVEANLAGHDSHGVIRVTTYVDWVRDGKVLANQHIKVVFENDAIAVVDGQSGFGQVIGEEAMQLGINKARKQGVAVIALRNSGHLGQIGAWALMAARAGLVSLHYVNTTGAGILVAPHGGINRRLSANPIAAGVPVKDGPPMVMDISACTVAEGKIRVALNKGVQVPDNCLIDSKGQPTTDPATFYGPPPGAILPIAGHKGYCLGMIAEVLAGALTGGSCSNPNEKRVINNMLTVLFDLNTFQVGDYFLPELDRFINYVKSSEKVSPNAEILMPGELEAQNRERRLSEGIELDEKTWGQIAEVCRSVKVEVPSEAELMKSAASNEARYYRGCRG